MNKVENRNKQLLKFIIYMTFLFLIISLAFISKKKNDNNFYYQDESNESSETNKETTYLDMQKSLINGNYHYTFKIENKEEIIFKGESKSGVRSGIKKIGEKEIAYTESPNEKTLDSKLYTELDKNLFDFNILFDKLNSTSTIISRSINEIVYTYKNVNNYNVEVYLNNEHITKIVIKDNDTTYYFSFNYEE